MKQEVKNDKILEEFFYRGDHLTRTVNGFYKGGVKIGEQTYKDFKQYKQSRIEKGWDSEIKWIY